MLRIDLIVEFVSPALSAMNGKIEIRQDKTFNLLASCKFEKEKGSTGYNTYEGEKPSLLVQLQPVIDVMIHSYYDGIQLADKSFAWVGNEDEFVDGLLVPVTSKVVVNPDSFRLPNQKIIEKP
jgi:hypothetical protein